MFAPSLFKWTDHRSTATPFLYMSHDALSGESRCAAPTRALHRELWTLLLMIL